MVDYWFPHMTFFTKDWIWDFTKTIWVHNCLPYILQEMMADEVMWWWAYLCKFWRYNDLARLFPVVWTLLLDTWPSSQWWRMPELKVPLTCTWRRHWSGWTWARCLLGSCWCWSRPASAPCSRAWCHWRCTCTGTAFGEWTLTWRRWRTPAIHTAENV